MREAFSLIGCEVTLQADKDSDGIITFNDDVALLEATGSKGTIKMVKIGELTTNIGNYMIKKENQVKGILVGNPFCEEKLGNRPPKNSQKPLFARELLGSAEKQSITVLLTTDLYTIVSRIVDNDITPAEKEGIIQKIFQGRGLVTLSS